MRATLFSLATGCLLLPGCAGVQDYHYSLVNEFRAYRAWAGTVGKRDVPYLDHFGAGWRKGYFDVSTGRCGKAPVIPPKTYWSACKQTNKGAAELEAWYQGYQQGAIAADVDGFGNWHRLPAHGLVGPLMNGMPIDGVPVDANIATDLPLAEPTRLPPSTQPEIPQAVPITEPRTEPPTEEVPVPSSAGTNYRSKNRIPTGEAEMQRLPPVVPVNYVEKGVAQ